MLRLYYVETYNHSSDKLSFLYRLLIKFNIYLIFLYFYFKLLYSTLCTILLTENGD